MTLINIRVWRCSTNEYIPHSMIEVLLNSECNNEFCHQHSFEVENSRFEASINTKLLKRELEATYNCIEANNFFIHLTKDGIKRENVLQFISRNIKKNITYKIIWVGNCRTIAKQRQLLDLANHLKNQTKQTDDTFKASFTFTCEDFVYYFIECADCLFSVGLLQNVIHQRIYV